MLQPKCIDLVFHPQVIDLGFHPQVIDLVLHLEFTDPILYILRFSGVARHRAQYFAAATFWSQGASVFDHRRQRSRVSAHSGRTSR
jgi:hypothetical protein